ncbi:hypothetical protein K432DRAFT_132961 [Lepidopterella palustris CBS 459.81]|uniref:Uncharacterized protein n=1 Tax=Lepidopterella palustris CBS 459.81 TaxID=1314670 RepID=A0A8E2JC39_9PEZI|nr:hypothetical protein K432DRAFT_132961 [Lepidopterella palustris CBS 459.81]
MLLRKYVLGFQQMAERTCIELARSCWLVATYCRWRLPAVTGISPLQNAQGCEKKIHPCSLPAQTCKARPRVTQGSYTSFVFLRQLTILVRSTERLSSNLSLIYIPFTSHLQHPVRPLISLHYIPIQNYLYHIQISRHINIPGLVNLCLQP